ncbi:division/cell wall cluster transcriptional repressor MraZ [Thermus thermamylovorans]|uniref:Transcriptional regulator MraZ n=1 Tax=Thermus thermamylovorans TaxID=2509362 RepID=A0A4Q9B772_9DEIN|nr:division/cell wall cluster transcriptional repressor MraZ [Thermus thermamylovorans]TBH21584.1 transcriptional regulator MraZ [Thermus thermamylovorans]
MPFGEYQYSLDDKGRVVVPAPFRDFLEDGLVLTRGMEGCLYVFPSDRWRKIEEQLVNLPLTDAEARAFVRFFYSGAHKTRMDNASRVLIPPPLRQFAGLEEGSEVVIAGAPGRLEIWSQERWWKAIEAIMQSPPAPEALRGLIG